jgi:hypothetical protein
VAWDLGVTTPGPPPFGLVRGVARLPTRWLEVDTRTALQHWYVRLPWKRMRRVHPVRWDRVEKVAARHGAALRGYAATHRLAKDPLFTWTLPVWIAARAPIDHVVVCVRDLDAMVSSRSASGLSFFYSTSAMRSAFVYGIGLALTSLWDHGLSHTVLRFPDFLDEPSTLAAALAPTGVSAEAVCAALARLADRSLVSDHRPAPG